MLKSKLNKVKLAIFDFDGVFTDNRVHISEDGKEFVSCWRGDGIGLSKLKEKGILIYVISTEKNSVVGQRCKKLKLDYFQGCDDKLSILKKLIKKHKCCNSEVLFVGNDTNDLECLKIAGVSIVVSDAHEDVIGVSDYITKKSGGFGAVREVCDLLLYATNKR